MRRLTVASLVVAGLLSLSWITGYPGSLLDEAAGTTSQTLCTKVFVSGLDPDAAFNEHLLPEPGMKLIAWAITRDVDRTHREVRTRSGPPPAHASVQPTPQGLQGRDGAEQTLHEIINAPRPPTA